MDFDQTNPARLSVDRPRFEAFAKLRKTEDGLHTYDTSVGTYTIAESESDGFVVSLVAKSTGFLLVTERLSAFPIVCCKHHALEAAEYFCYGNMLALLPSEPNPKSPWARHG